MSDRPNEPEPEVEPEPEPAVEQGDADLDTSSEPEPEWAEAIRRGCRERAERVREQLEAPKEDPEETAE